MLLPLVRVGDSLQPFGALVQAFIDAVLVVELVLVAVAIDWRRSIAVSAARRASPA
jgi:hypothetical protein